MSSLPPISAAPAAAPSTAGKPPVSQPPAPASRPDTAEISPQARQLLAGDQDHDGDAR